MFFNCQFDFLLEEVQNIVGLSQSAEIFTFHELILGMQRFFGKASVLTDGMFMSCWHLCRQFVGLCECCKIVLIFIWKEVV